MDAVKIAPTPLEAITAPATRVINLHQAIRAVQVNGRTSSCSDNHLSKEIIAFVLDINECILNISGCSQNCTNTIGSYYCSCYSGYQLVADLMSCSGKLYKLNIHV